MDERTLLCVDDEQGVLHSLRRLLRREPYRVRLTSGGAEALTLMEREPAQVILADYRMPGMSGTELLRKIKERYPGTVRVVLSGFADAAVILDMINEGEIYRFLPKPWDDEELKVTIRQCFERYALLQENQQLLADVQRKNEKLAQWTQELERKVNERTRSLQLAQEVLERLPFPVLGVDPEGLIVLINSAARTVLDDGAPMLLGNTVPEVLPSEVAGVVTDCLDRHRPVSRKKCVVNGRSYYLYVDLLNEAQNSRGGLVLMHEA